MITVKQLTEADEQAVSEINTLLRQLRGDGSSMGTLEELKSITSAEHVAMVVAEEEGKIVGVGSLYALQKMGKRSGIVEDVVVDESQRGKGIGEKIMRMIIDIAREQQLSTVSLTSRPSRAAAHHLYQKLGFEKRDTTPFRLRL